MGVIRNTYEQQQQIIKDNDAFRASYNGTQNQSQYVDYTAPDPNAGQQQQQVQQVEAPRYWTPQQINLQYLQDQNTPETPDEIRPGGASREGIAQANNYYSIVNNNAPVTDWKTQEQDPYYDSIIKPNWGDPTVVQPATVEDPLGAILPATPDYGKGNWEDMNWLGKTYSALSSSNTAEGAPAWKNLTAAIIPSVTSAGGGAALGAAVAAGLTMAGLAVPVMPAAVIGGTATAAAMFVQSAFGVKIPVINQVLEAIDIAATKSEQVWGTAEQYIYRGEVENAGEFILELAKLGLGMDSKLGDRDNFDAKMAAASARYETKTTGLGDTAIDAINSLYNVFAEEDMAISKPGEAYLYNRGLMDPQQVQTPEGPEALDMLAGVASELVKTVNPETEKEYTYREASDLVQQWAMDTFGTTAQFNELIESSIYDPANLVPFISSYAVKKYGDITGDAAYSTAGNLTMGNPFIDALPPVFQQAAEAVAHKFGKRGGSQGFFSVLDTYQNVLRYGTKLDTMTAGQMANAKLTADGKFAELQPTNRTGRFGWLQSLFDQTPESKALGLTALSNDLITAVASTSPDIESFKANLLALVNDTAPDSNSPIAGIWGTAAWKTSLDDLKTIVKKGDYNVLFEQFGLTDGNRAALVDISNGLGKKQKDVVTLTEENPDLLKTMIADYAAQHEGKIGNVIVDDGGENAVAMLKLYTGKTPVAWNDQILRYEVAAKISDGLSDILIQRYGIKEDHAIFRISNLMKKAQSVLLLGFSPSYVANNLINNIVTRASVGAIGAVTLGQYTTFLEKSGIFPARFAEDAGLLRGDYSDASTPYGKATQNISDAKRKGDLIDTAGDAIGKTNKFSLGKLTRKIESTEGQRAFGAGIMQYFHREWKPGKDFRKMDKALETAIEMQSPGLSKFIYSTIGQNYNMADIEKALYSAILTPDASEVLTNIGKRLFPNDPYVVSEIFDKAGITNELQERMKNAKTRAEREQVVKDIINNSEKYRDRMAANEIANMAEAAGNITTAEGLPGAHEMLINQALYEQEHWGSHISAMSRAYDIKEKYGLSNEAWTNTISSVMARVQQDWKHSNEISLQLDKGIIDGLGMSDMIGREYSKAMIDQHAARRNYYAQKSEHVNEVYRITKDIYSNKKLSDEQKAIQVRTAWDNFYDRTEADYIEYFNKYEMPMMIKRQDLFMKAYEEATGADTSKLKATFDSLITIRGEMFDAEVEVHKKTREIRQSSMDRAAKDQACNQVEAEHNVFKNGKINEMRELNVKIANESAKDGFVARAENGVKAPEAPAAVTTADQIKSAIELQHFAKEADVGKTDAQVKNQGYMDRDAIRNEYIDNNYSEAEADLLMEIYDERAKQWESENPGKNFYTEALRIREITRDMGVDQGLFQWETIAETDINTPQFRQAFGKTKVVDESGNPKVVYHGSPNAFEEFSYKFKGAQGSTEGYGFYFSDDISIAEDYAKGTDNIYKSYVNIEKPLNGETLSISKAQLKKLLAAIDEADMKGNEPEHWFLSDYGDIQREGMQSVLKTATDMLYDNNTNDIDLLAEIINTSGGAEKVYRTLKQVLGYDGIITKWAANDARGEVNIYIPFLPEQIKSVYNKGDWDMNNPNMLFQTYAAAVADGSPWYSHMETVIADKFPEKMNTQSVRNWLIKQGVTKQELQWTGMDEYLDSATGQVTKADLQRVVDMDRMRIEEVNIGGNTDKMSYADWEYLTREKIDDYDNDIGSLMLEFDEEFSFDEIVDTDTGLLKETGISDVDYLISERNELWNACLNNIIPENVTRYASYITDGDNNNYTEKIITLPEVDAQYRSTHWGNIGNPVFHVRFDDRIDSQGRKILFIEEFQSDWAQHLKDGETAPLADVWERKAIQRMMNYAADGDYDMVAWAPGSEHLARYRLGVVADEITFRRGNLEASKNGKNVFRQNIEESKLADYIGKQKADQILNSQEYQYTGKYTLTGDDLAIGDTWALKFYDQDIANATQKIIKRYGSELETTLIDTGNVNMLEVQAYKVTHSMAEPQKLFQAFQNSAKGSFEVLDGDSIIRLFKAKDVSTMVHESGHAFRRTLSDRLMTDFSKWAGFETLDEFRKLEHQFQNDYKNMAEVDRKLYVDAEEKFARGWEQYLIDGSAPTIGLKAIFRKFTNYLLDIYKSIKNLATKDYSRQGEFVFDGQVLDIQAEVNGIKLRDIFDSMLTDDVQRSDYDSIVSKRIDTLSDDAKYRTWDKERLYKQAKREVNGEILNRFGDFHNAEYVAATMERPFDLGNDMIVDDVTLYEAIADAKANTGQNPFIGEDGIYGDSISTPEQSRYSFEQKEFATPDDALFYYDQQQDSYDRGTAVPLEDAGNLDLTGWDPNRINELRQNLYDLMLEGMDPQYHEYGRAYADSVIGNKDAMNEIVSRNAAVPEDIRGEFYHRYMINEKLISDINRERDIAANMSVNRIPMEGGFFLKRMPEQQFGEFTIIGNVYRDGQLVAYYPYNLTTDAIQTSDGRNIKVLGVDPMNADQYVYYDALANEVDTVNTRTPRGFENAYEQSEGETLVNRGTPLGATPMIEVDGSANNEILNDYIYPILDEFPAEYEKAYAEGIDKNLKNVDQDTRVRVMKYLDDVVQPDMASSKFNAMKFGEFKRDAALLNYSKTYGFDSYLTMISPYQFWYTRSMMNWAKRLVDKPAYLTMAMRMKNLAERNKQEEYPYRLNDLFRIPFAGLPDWMGGGIFVDILPQIFPFLQFGSPVEDLLSEQNTINKKAYSVLDEMIEANQITEAQKTEAIRTKNNDIWNTALAQAKLEYGSDPSINSLFEQYLSPPLLLSWAKKIYEGKENEIGMLPITRFGNTIGTLTDDTFLEGLGQVTKSAMTAPEKAMRKIAGLDYKEFGEYQDYNIKKQISQMVLEGLPVQDGLNAMVEMSGDIYDEAVKRQREENALKTQGALPIYEMKRLLQGEEGASMSGVLAALAFAPLGVKIFPTGEQAAREAQTGLNQAYIDKDNGDSNAVSRFWDENKEYYARLASFKDSPEELMRYVLHSYSKNFYYDQPKAQQQAILNNYGPEFYKAVIDPTTSNYRNVDIDKLAFWAQGLTGNIPNIPQLEAVRNQKQTLQLYAPQVVSDYDLYIQERDRLFPGQSAKNTPFYSLDKTQKAAYEKTDPVYAQYRQWEYEYKKAHPNVQTVKDDQSNYYDEKMAYESFGDMDDSVVEDFDHWAVTGLPMRGTTTRVLNNLYKKYANPNFDNYDQYLDILKRYRQ